MAWQDDFAASFYISCLSPSMFLFQMPWLLRWLDHFAVLFPHFWTCTGHMIVLAKLCVFVLDLDFNPPRALVGLFRLHCLVKFYFVSLCFFKLVLLRRFFAANRMIFVQSALCFACSHSFTPPTLLISHVLPFLGVLSFRRLLSSAMWYLLSAMGYTHTIPRGVTLPCLGSMLALLPSSLGLRLFNQSWMCYLL